MTMKKTPQPQIRSQPRRIAARAFAAILLLTQAVVANAWGDGGDAISATVELPLDWPLGCENTDDNIQDIDATASGNGDPASIDEW